MGATSLVHEVTTNLYGIADTIGCSLLQSEKFKDEWYAISPREAKLGPWKVSISNAAWTDQASETGASVYHKIKGDLWSYIYYRDSVLRMVLFDGKLLGISREGAPTFGAKNIDLALDELAPIIKATFQHNHKDGWVRIGTN